MILKPKPIGYIKKDDRYNINDFTVTEILKDGVYVYDLKIDTNKGVSSHYGVKWEEVQNILDLIEN